MLKIIVPGEEYFDDAKEEFVSFDAVSLELEHSLYSLSKWESILEKPFLTAEDKTREELLLYVECMIVSPDFPPEVFSRINNDLVNQIADYINSKQSATWFRDDPNAPPSREIITAELIYYWMVVLNIPFECQYWHLSKLFTLIKVCNIKQSKPKPMSAAEAAAQRRELNAKRRAQLNSKG